MHSLIARAHRSPLFASTDVAELFDAMVGGVASAAAAPSMPIDVVEDDAGITVYANVPGFAKDEVSVEFHKDESHKGVLTLAATRGKPGIPGARASAAEREDGCCGGGDCSAQAAPAGATSRMRTVIRERPTSSVRRSLQLPDRVTGEGIAAALVDGVLEVRLPYAPKPSPRRISVN